MARTQPNVSRIEKGTEMQLSTLRAYIEALGGRLEVSAVFDDRYGHLFPELDEAIATSFSDRLAEARTKRDGNVVHGVFGEG